jgi:hypothetical protein
MFKGRRMKLVCDHTKVIGKSFGAMTEFENGFDQVRRLRRHLSSEESKLDRKHGQLLIQAVMKFSSNTTPLLFLGIQKFAGQILKSLSCTGTFQCHASNSAIHRITLQGFPAPPAGILNTWTLYSFSCSGLRR